MVTLLCITPCFEQDLQVGVASWICSLSQASVSNTELRGGGTTADMLITCMEALGC